MQDLTSGRTAGGGTLRTEDIQALTAWCSVGAAGWGIAAQIAFARRESLHRGERHLGLAKVVSAEMPNTMAAWTAGRVDEFTVTQLARETACLSREDRMAVDAEVAGDAEALEAMSTRQAAVAASAAAYRRDPMSFVERRRKAEADRHTSLRPAPDVMSWFMALLSVKQGVAVHAALSVEADRKRAAGDPRSRGQVMADVLVERVIAPLVAHVGDGTGDGGQQRAAVDGQPGGQRPGAAR